MVELEWRGGMEGARQNIEICWGEREVRGVCLGVMGGMVSCVGRGED